MPYDRSTMRVALFGGTFDPPHRGHVALARLARNRLRLDHILVAPVAVQPLKHQSPSAAPFADRVAMTRLAFAGEPNTEISLLDAPHPDGSSNYTIDTLNTLRRQFTPADEIFCILGADSLLAIRNWHRPADLLLACDFIIGARPGFDLTQAAHALPDAISASPQPSNLAHTQILELSLRKSSPQAAPPTRLYLLLDLAEDVSATRIRADIHAALSGIAQPDSVLPATVAKYIRAHHLYQHL
jgi:nicotinate-nucleotide adenylyltransferase